MSIKANRILITNTMIAQSTLIRTTLVASAQAAAAHTSLDIDCATEERDGYAEAIVDPRTAYERIGREFLAIALASWHFSPTVAEWLSAGS